MRSQSARGFWTVAALAAIACAPLAARAEDAAARQKECLLERTVPVRLKYLLYLPKDYQQKPAWPLLLFLHGAGERGDDLARVKIHGPPKRIAAGDDFPMIVVSPQCPKDQWWQPLELGALLDEIGQKYKVDLDRVYVTGLSMGGFGTWSLAGYMPQRFAAIAPVCGGGERLRMKQIVHLPAWVFHGAKDTVVPLSRSEELVAALKKNGGNPKFTVYPDAAHDSWTATYANPEFYEWLLAQRRPAPTAAKP